MFLKSNITECFEHRIGGKKMKKIVSLAILFLVCSSIFCGIVVAKVSPGPSEEAGDGIPEGNPEIRPENPGVGPAPGSGDGIPDGPEWDS